MASPAHAVSPKHPMSVTNPKAALSAEFHRHVRLSSREGVPMSATIIWQLTRNCELDCNDCLSVADPFRANTHELTTFEAYKTIDQVAALKPQRFIITGGDPLTRKDIFELVQYA